MVTKPTRIRFTTIGLSDNVHAKPNVGHGKRKLTRKVKKMSITFTKDKETKNKVRFSVNSQDVQGSIYVSKDSELASNDTISLEISEYEEVS